LDVISSGCLSSDLLPFILLLTIAIYCTLTNNPDIQ